MTPGDLLIAVIGAAVAILLALFRVSYQAGQIRQGVAGLYGRVERIEKWIDRRAGG